MNTRPACYIISAYTNKSADEDNRDQHVYLGRKLAVLGLPKKEVIGLYKGNQEWSWFIVPDGSTTPNEDRAIIQQLLDKPDDPDVTVGICPVPGSVFPGPEHREFPFPEAEYMGL